MGKRKRDRGFWGLFDDAMDKLDDVMDSLPSHIDNEIKSGNNSVTTVGRNNVVINGSSSVTQRSVFGSSTSTIVQSGKKIEVKTKNGKTIIKVNGKEVYKEN